MTEQAHHFFGSCAIAWAVGTTRQEVLTKLAKELAENSGLLLAANVKKSGGVYAGTVRVDAPMSTEYLIRNYAPFGVATSKPLGVLIMNKHGHVTLPEDVEHVLAPI